MMDPISLLQSLFLFDPSKPLIFTQFYFWAFFAVVFALFALVHSKILLRNAFLFFASLFFYYKTSGSYLVLLAFCVLANFIGGHILYRIDHRGKKIFSLVVLVIINLLTLGYFKLLLSAKL